MTSWMWPYSRADRPDREQRLGPLGQRLADADQDAGGERHADPAGVLEHPQPDRRLLVRASRSAGRPARDHSRVAVVSSIMPMLGATGLSRCSSAQLSTPGLRCGSRPVSSSTAIAQART